MPGIHRKRGLKGQTIAGGIIIVAEMEETEEEEEVSIRTLGGIGASLEAQGGGIMIKKEGLGKLASLWASEAKIRGSFKYGFFY